MRLSACVLALGLLSAPAHATELQALLRLPGVQRTLFETEQGRNLLGTLLVDLHLAESASHQAAVRQQTLDALLRTMALPQNQETALLLAGRLERIETRLQRLTGIDRYEQSLRTRLAATELQTTVSEVMVPGTYRQSALQRVIRFEPTLEDQLRLVLSAGAAPGASARSFFLSRARPASFAETTLESISRIEDVCLTYRMLADSNINTDVGGFLASVTELLEHTDGSLRTIERLHASLPNGPTLDDASLTLLNSLDHRLEQLLSLQNAARHQLNDLQNRLRADSQIHTALVRSLGVRPHLGSNPLLNSSIDEVFQQLRTQSARIERIVEGNLPHTR